jgi:O-antigen/teichoic acid export membrane protein
LIKVGVGPLLFIAIVAPRLFPIVFGAQWHRSGEILLWLTPMFIFQYLAVPLSMALHVVGRQSTAVILQMFGVLIRTGSVAVGVHRTSLPLPERFAVASAVLYFTYLVVICFSTGVSTRRLFRGGHKLAAIVAAWACAGFVLRWGVILYQARGG